MNEINYNDKCYSQRALRLRYCERMFLKTNGRSEKSCVANHVSNS